MLLEYGFVKVNKTRLPKNSKTARNAINCLFTKLDTPWQPCPKSWQSILITGTQKIVDYYCYATYLFRCPLNISKFLLLGLSWLFTSVLVLLVHFLAKKARGTWLSPTVDWLDGLLAYCLFFFKYLDLFILS